MVIAASCSLMPAPFVINEREVETFAPPHHDATESRELINPARGSDRVVFRISDIDPGGHDA